MQTISTRLHADRPEGWTHKDSITLLAPDSMANVIFSSEALAPGVTTLDQYASNHVADLQDETQFPMFQQLAFEVFYGFGGREGRIRRYEWTPSGGTRVTQVQVYYVEDGRGYVATATTPTANFASIEPVLREILDSLRLGPQAAESVRSTLA